MSTKPAQLFCLCLALFLVSCSSDENVAPAQIADMSEGRFHSVETIKEKYEVTYRDDTVIVSEDAMHLLTTMSTTQDELVFAAEAKQLLNLEVGKVTIFPLTALRRVTAIEERGDKIVVSTDPAILTDAIQDADIELISRIGWKPLGQAVSRTHGIEQTGPVRFRLFSEAYADDEGVDASRDGVSWTDSISFSKDLGKGVKIKFKLTPESWDKLKYEVTIIASKALFKKSITAEEVYRRHPTEQINASNWYGTNARESGAGGSFGDYAAEDVAPEPGSDEEPEATVSLGAELGGKAAVAKLTGYVSGFESALDMQVADSTTTGFGFGLSNLKGEAKLVGASLNDVIGTVSLKIPLEISIPLRVGLIPVTLKIGAEVSFRPIVKNGSAQLCFVARYDGASGIRFDNGALSNQSDAQDRTLTTCPESETVSAGDISVGMGATVKFPSISLALFGNVVVPNIHIKVDGKTFFEPGIRSAQPSCQSGNATLAAIVEIKMSFLGSELERTAKLWESKKEWTCDDQIVTTTFDKGVGGQSTTTGT